MIYAPRDFVREDPKLNAMIGHPYLVDLPLDIMMECGVAALLCNYAFDLDRIKDPPKEVIDVTRYKVYRD